MIVLEKYQIIEEVGRGGMGLVYKALDLRLGRTVALKELVISQTIIGADRDDIVARFKQEAQTAAFLNHPNIITIFDVGEENNRHFIAMEFLPGKSLKDYLDEDYKYSDDELLDILIQIASGLEHAHLKGIVHRDIKPDNMKILTDNVVKITDFGIARIESSTSNLTQDGTMLGTLGYISPEQLHNSKGVDSRADIFSYGAMLYEIYTKKLPFDGGTVGSTILKIMTEAPVPPRKIVPELNEDIERIILKCLQKDPSERYQKFKEIIQELTIIKIQLSKSKEAAQPKE
ncbi:serine/threonine protein kinase, partial [bacterium]